MFAFWYGVLIVLQVITAVALSVLIGCLIAAAVVHIRDNGMNIFKK